MTNEQERKMLKLEIDARKEIIRKIQTVYNRLNKRAEKNLQMRKDKVTSASEYASIGKPVKFGAMTE